MSESSLLVDWQSYPVLKEVYGELASPLRLTPAREVLSQFIVALQQGGETAKPIYEMLLGELGSLAMTSDHWLIARYSIDLSQGQQLSSVERLSELCGSIDFSFEVSNYIYWNLVSKVFAQRHQFEDNLRYTILDRAFSALFEKYKVAINQIEAEQAKSATDDSIAELLDGVEILIITNQFLGPKHSPTRLCTDMATFYQGLGYNTVVINANILPTQAESLFIGGGAFNSVQQFSLAGYDIHVDSEVITDFRANGHTYSRVIRGEEHFKFLQCSDLISQKTLLDAVIKQQPKLVISLSDSNLMSESLASSGLSTICFPTVSDTPVTIYSPALLRTKVDKQHLAYTKFKDSKFTPDHYPHRHIASTELSRKELGWSEQQFVLVVVGSRLHAEVDAAMCDCLHQLLSASANIAVAFVGTANLQAPQQLKEFSERVFVHGHQKDLYSLIHLSDMFINPDRVGGGTGCVMALAAGKPVAALEASYSDVAWSAGENFCFTTWLQLAEFVLNCHNDTDFYLQQSNLAIKRNEPKLDDSVAYQALLKDMAMPLPMEGA